MNMKFRRFESLYINSNLSGKFSLKTHEFFANFYNKSPRYGKLTKESLSRLNKLQLGREKMKMLKYFIHITYAEMSELELQIS